MICLTGRRMHPVYMPCIQTCHRRPGFFCDTQLASPLDWLALTWAFCYICSSKIGSGAYTTPGTFTFPFYNL